MDESSSRIASITAKGQVTFPPLLTHSTRSRAPSGPRDDIDDIQGWRSQMIEHEPITLDRVRGTIESASHRGTEHGNGPAALRRLRLSRLIWRCNIWCFPISTLSARATRCLRHWRYPLFIDAALVGRGKGEQGEQGEHHATSV